ncbi:unnamed protein product [Cylicocyclus nassatus]|uniref:UBL3-like ubiquitin domain-containing protein n=1 Tax=Cylicocyclus nassatus TaxID=53992 RepID=A0AA36GTW0_CYLNA|nr:unnamed protein product [Cylicocyclus nassatus]
MQLGRQMPTSAEKCSASLCFSLLFRFPTGDDFQETATYSATPMSNKGSKDSSPSSENVTLRLILVSGRTHEFQFHPLTPAHEVTQKVFEQWPKEWADEKVESASMLKLIYHGRFLHGSVTLNALNLPQGKTTVMHLVTRENLPEPNSSDSLSKRKRGSCCRCVLS